MKSSTLLRAYQTAEAIEAHSQGMIVATRVDARLASLLEIQPGFSVEIRSYFTADPATLLRETVAEIHDLQIRLRRLEGALSCCGR